MRRIVWVFAASGLALVASGCARLDYVKVPTPTQYAQWSDDDQRDADAMRGVRYYLPRPFLHLKQSVPVAQRVAFVGFKLNASRTAYELDPPTNPPTWLGRVLPQRMSFVQALALTAEGAPSMSKAGLESARPGEGEQPEPAPPAPRPPSQVSGKTGFINEEDPVTPLGSLMDVVYLPDFEEQYVIQPRGGLGTVDIETRLRNGWAAEVFTQQVDNSNLIPYVIDQVEDAASAATDIAAKFGLKIATGGVAPVGVGEALGARLESASPEEVAAAKRKALDVIGESLLFKVVEIKMAQPGLYPILKPREVRDWLTGPRAPIGADPQATFENFLQQANLPWIRPDMAFVPCPPFTMIGFNATTDVFLAPVTDRVRLEAKSTSSSVEEGQGAQGAAAKAAAALATAAATQAAVIKDFVGGGGGIQVTPGPTPNQTKIRVGKEPGNTAATPSSSDKAAIIAWLKAAFEGLKDAQIKDPRFSSQAFEVIVVRSPGQLAGMAR